MSVIERGILEVTADTSGVEAGMRKAEQSIRNLGRVSRNESARQSASISDYVRQLEIQAVTFGKTTREAELFRLRLRGANAEQLRVANAALRMTERQEHLLARMDRIRSAATAVGVALGAAFAGAAIGLDRLIKSAAQYGDLATKMGDTPEAVASLAVAAADGGSSVSALVTASNQLAKSLTGVNDESKNAGAAVKALGLDIGKLKTQTPVEQLTTIARAMEGFADGPEKAAAAMALFGRSGADLLPVLKALAQENALVNSLSNEQIATAKRYADTQARVGAEIKASAQAIAIEAAPILTEFTKTIRDLATDQEFAATAAAVLRGALQGGIIVFQSIAILVSDVGFVLKMMGQEIGAIAAQIAALARLDLRGFTAISDAVTEDAARARAELDRFQARVLSIGQKVEGQDASFQRLEDRRLGRGRTRPRLPFDGADKKGRTGKSAAERAAEQERKEQLRADLSEIKSGSDRVLSIFSQAEKVMEARRSAALIDEREYWEAKRGFLRLNADEEARALEAQIARLQQEKVKGKEAIANAREIAEAQSKLAQVREQAATEGEVLNIREADSARKLAQAYADASASAREYLDAIARRNSREVEGVGRGERFREQQQELNAIEDTFLKEKGRLDRELRRGDITREQFGDYLRIARETYAEEVKLYQQRTVAMDRAQGEWANGFSESLTNYIDNVRDVAHETETLFDGVFGTLEDAIFEFATTGKLSFKSLFDSIAAEVSRFASRQIMGAFLGSLGGGSGGGVVGGIASLIGGQAMAAAGPTTGDFARMDRLAGAGEAVGAAATVANQAAQTAAITANTVAIASETASRTAFAAAETAASAAIAAASASSAAALAALTAAAGSASAALATVAASSAASGSTSLIAAVIGGGRAVGGPVSPGSLYQVNERGPELLRVAGKQYLMLGDAPGDVRPLDRAGQQGGTIVQVNVTPPTGASRETALQWGATAGRHIRTALRRNG